MGKEEPYIRLWRELFEKSLGWESSDTWNEYDFEKLGEIIFSKTNTRLSLSTLKRLWGKVQYKSTPTIATLNVLAHALDFEDWRAFRKKMDENTFEGERSAYEIPSSYPSYKRPLLITVVVVCAGLMILFITKLFKTSVNTNKYDAMKEVFESRVVSDQMPNSVVFNYDASNDPANEIYLQQSWDPKRTEKISKNRKQHTSIYYYPGYFNAKLVADGQIRKTASVFIKTNGWMGIIDKSPVPVYLNADSMNLQGGMGIKSQTFVKLKGSSVLNDAWVHFYNFRYFEGASGHDLDFETTLRNTSAPEQSSCRKVTVEIVGTENEISIPLSDKGCIATLNLSLGRETIFGKDHDLSAFGCDFNSFQHLSCSIQNSHIKISLNDKVIYSGLIAQDIGKIVGIGIGFEGAGEIKYVQLGSRQKVIYRQALGK
ncbi:hypothetical protein JN11_00700 [Mucilaginibacter frigoritolerans]|uniref:Uncharacterized protein n=1 Tax=Mucilaginibacter frigoritolerans TaxID=652788 RepID=A0A562UBJ9_9SPHI|nr:hypothetical protein [Mucilaginibacter frigoritolerans]TWJ03163.1 hypothetical protein JN11_00700 [Mucilaginibacter frigoritolerans]